MQRMMSRIKDSAAEDYNKAVRASSWAKRQEMHDVLTVDMVPPPEGRAEFQEMFTNAGGGTSHLIEKASIIASPEARSRSAAIRSDVSDVQSAAALLAMGMSGIQLPQLGHVQLSPTSAHSPKVEALPEPMDVSGEHNDDYLPQQPISSPRQNTPFTLGLPPGVRVTGDMPSHELAPLSTDDHLSSVEPSDTA